MATEAKPAGEAAKNEKQDIYSGYSGTWAGPPEIKNDKNGKPFGVATLKLTDEHSVTVRAFGEGQIEKLKDAITNSVGVVHGYLSGDGISFHEAGDKPFFGNLANLRGGASEKGVAWANAILTSQNEEGKKFNHVLKAFGEAAEIINEAGEGGYVEVKGHLTREKVGDGFRSGIAVNTVDYSEPAVEAKKEADSPSP